MKIFSGGYDRSGKSQISITVILNLPRHEIISVIYPILFMYRRDLMLNTAKFNS